MWAPASPCSDRWWFGRERRQGDVGHADESDFHRLTRNRGRPPGEMGYWQGALRDSGSPEFAVATAAIRGRQDMTIKLLGTDYLGHQRTISRFILMPVGLGGSLVRGPDPALESRLARSAPAAGRPGVVTSGSLTCRHRGRS